MNLVILGPQGCGKGTQAEMLAEKFNIEHIDMGNFLREVAKMDTPLGREVFDIQNVTKTLVPSRILREVLHFKLADMPQEKGIVFDGVPRTMDQAKYFEEALLEFGRKLTKLVYIKLSEEESIGRISKRRECQSCRKRFIIGKDIKENEKTCFCGGKITQRIDDTPEGIKKRLKVFEEETVPVINYFDKKGLVMEINGNKSPKEVFEEVLKKLKSVI
ncbi:MAG TPA: nucleoside monophosphate kinase [Candidatus Moranbacteria bacterium]|nr:nucleoside monophosphate kinase [Candidatus Moranbacteria bacterium]